MLVKAGVDISRLERPMRRGLGKIEKVYYGRGDELVITSTYEGDHGASSLHYANLAVDIRYTSKTKAREGVVDELRRELGKDYDVVPEKDHIHIEYDPK